jgi:hypothetical protein
MMAATTWRSKSGLIMFHLAMPSRGQPVASIRLATNVFLEAVKIIGVAREVEVSTRSGGEGAHEWSDVIDGPQIAQRLEAYPDITAVLIRCDLHCEDRDASRLAIPSGMTFWVQLVEVDSHPDAPLEMNVTLDADVYVAKSWGDDRDNRDLAQRNAPAFNRFLANLLRDTGATVESVSAEDYRGQVDATGIVLPALGARL